MLNVGFVLEEILRQLAQPVWASGGVCGRELAVDVFQRVCERRDVGILLDPVFEEGFNGGSIFDRVQDVRTDRGVLQLHVILMFRAQLRPWWCIFRVDAKRPALENPPSLFTMFLRQQQMTQLMKEQLESQAALGLMDPNWTATPPLTFEAPAARGPGDLRNYLQVNRAVQTPQQASHGQSTLHHPIRTQGRGRGRNSNRHHRGRQQNRNTAAPQSNRRRARQTNMPEPGQGNRPK